MYAISQRRSKEEETCNENLALNHKPWADLCVKVSKTGSVWSWVCFLLALCDSVCWFWIPFTAKSCYWRWTWPV